MKIIKPSAFTLIKSLALSVVLAFSSSVLSAPLPALVDDFNHNTNNTLNLPRQFMSDAIAGGNSTIEPKITAGIMQVTGDIAPARGQPGWASSVLPLSAEGSAQDASQFSGIKLLVKISSGNVNISANSTEITNFDYHAAPIVVAADGKFHEVKIPFNTMKRAWSEQTTLNAATLNSLSIVAFSLQPASFDFEVEEVSFY